MNFSRLYKNIKSIHFFTTILFFWGMTYSPSSLSGDSSVIGPGGGTNFTRSCKKTQRISGLDISTWEGIERIRARCTTYAPDGQWANNQHSFTSWTNYTSDIRNIVPFRACPAHRWVAEIEGISPFLAGGNNNLQSIKYKCFRGDENGNRSGEASEVSLARQRGGLQSKASCPQNELAYAISGTVKDKRRVSGLKLKCMIAKVIPTTTSSPISPGSSSTREIRAGINEFHFRPVNNATHYRVRILTDSRSPQSWFDQMFGGDLLFPNGRNDSYVKIRIPNNKVGTVAKWKVQACNKDRQCGPWSEWKRFSILSGR